MSPVVQAYVMAFLMWLAIIAFALLGGADFGAGVWDLLAWGRTSEQQRGALIRAIGPIWEANSIWLIFLVTGTFTGFPIVFSTMMTALFIPLSIGLIGIVMRGAAFAYYTHFRAAIVVSATWGRAFSIASIVTPFLFGCVAAAAVSGGIRVRGDGTVVANVITSWTTPFALSCGLFAVALCAVLAAVYMTVEVQNQGMHRLTLIFRRRALIAGAVAAALGTASAWLARSYATYLFNGLTTRALPLALLGVVLGALTGAALLIGYYRVARVLVGGMVLFVLGAWSVAQLPYLIVPDITVQSAAAPVGVESALIIATIVTMALVIPALYYLFYLFKSENRRKPPLSTDGLIEQIEARDHARLVALQAQQDGNYDGHQRLGHRLVSWLLRGVAALLFSLAVAYGRVAWSAVRRWLLRREQLRA